MFFKRFRVHLTLTFGLSSLIVMAGLSYALGALVSARLAEEQGEALTRLARTTGVMLAEGLHERMREVALLTASPEVARLGADPLAWQPVLERLRATREHYAWLGVTDLRGHVVAATRHMLVGQDVSARPWWTAARTGPYAGDVHGALLLGQLLGPDETGEPMRFIDFAAPLKDTLGRPAGVLGVHVGWDWTRSVIRQARTEEERRRGILVFILNRAGEVIHRPAGEDTAALAPGERFSEQPRLLRWTDGQTYLTTAVPMRSRDALTDLGWTVVLRQPPAEALRTASQARRTVLVLGAGAALAFMVLAWWMAGRIARPLADIARAALRIQAGDLSARIPEDSGTTELARLTQSLRGMTQTLVAREQALEQANSELEARVTERTAELERANRALEDLARKDGLTGLLNRRTGDERLAEEMAHHRRGPGGLGVVLLDVDHFKRINDTFGHGVGDEVLREIAQRLSQGCRGTDIVVRHGGEEFMVLLPHTPVEGARTLAEKLREVIAAQPFGVAGTVTASLGVASPAEHFANVSAALKAADEALYAAKAAGRNTVVVREGPAGEARPARLPT